MLKEQFDNLKRRYIEYVEYCYEHIPYKPDQISINFIFDNITEIGSISYYDIDNFDISYSNENDELKKFVNDSLLCLIEDLKNTRKDKPKV